MVTQLPEVPQNDCLGLRNFLCYDDRVPQFEGRGGHAGHNSFNISRRNLSAAHQRIYQQDNIDDIESFDHKSTLQNQICIFD